MKDSGGGFEQQDYLINWDKGPLGLVFRPDLGADMPPVVAQVLPQASVARLSGVRVGDLLLSVDGKKTSALGYEKVLRVLFKERLPLVLHFRMPFPSGGRELNNVPSEYGGQAMSHQSQMPMPQYQQPLVPQQYAVQPQPPQNYVQPQPPPRSQPKQQQQQRMRPPQQNGVVSLQAGGHGLMPSNSKGKRKQYSVVWEAGSLGISFRAYTSRVNVPVVDFIGVRGQGRNMELVCLNDVLIAINGEKTKALGVQKVLRWLHVIEKPVVLRFHSSSNRIEAPVQFQAPVDNQQPAHLTHYNNFVQQQQQQQNHAPAEFQRHYSTASNNNRERRADSSELPPRKFSVNMMPMPADPQDQQPPRKYSINRVGPPAESQDQQPPRKYSINRSGPPVYTQQPELKRHSSRNRLPPQHEPQVEPEPRQRRLSSSAIQARPDHIERDNLARTNPRDAGAHHEPSLFRAASTGRMIRSQSVDIEELSFQEAVAIVGRSSGKPIEQCVFGGVPLLEIREGTMQAKLMFIFAKACIAKEGRLEPSQSNGAAPQTPSKSSTPASQLNTTPGNPLGRNRHQFLTYSFTQDHDKRIRSTSTDSNRRTMNDDELLAPPQNGKGIARITSDVSKLSVDSHPEQPSIPEVSRESSKSSNDGDMISLKDFTVQGSRLTERLPSNAQDESAHDDILEQHSQQLQMTAALLAHDISTKVQASSPASSSGMISLADMAHADEQKTSPEPEEVKKPTSFDHPLISELYGAYPDMYDLIKDKTPEILMVKKDMIDEIQDILKSLQMEAQFERHSYFGTGSMINPSSPLSPMSTIHDRCCFQCGKIGQLADLAVDGGRRELYCQDCWEIFFFSEGRLSPSSTDSRDRFRSDDNITTGDLPNDCDDIRPSSNLAEETDDDEVAKYSFHDSASSMSDMIRNPWRNLNSMSSMRDSSMTTGSSITADEVWL